MTDLLLIPVVIVTILICICYCYLFNYGVGDPYRCCGNLQCHSIYDPWLTPPELRLPTFYRPYYDVVLWYDPDWPYPLPTHGDTGELQWFVTVICYCDLVFGTTVFLGDIPLPSLRSDFIWSVGWYGDDYDYGGVTVHCSWRCSVTYRYLLITDWCCLLLVFPPHLPTHLPTFYGVIDDITLYIRFPDLLPTIYLVERIVYIHGTDCCYLCPVVLIYVEFDLPDCCYCYYSYDCWYSHLLLVIVITFVTLRSFPVCWPCSRPVLASIPVTIRFRWSFVGVVSGKNCSDVPCIVFLIMI